MKKSKGSSGGLRGILLGLGCLCIIGAVGLATYNYLDEQRAHEASAELTQRMTKALTANVMKEAAQIDEELGEPVVTETTEIPAVNIDDYDVCGIITIPKIEIDLAVIRDWSYPNLSVSACRYSGSPDEQMIIMAHNNKFHFGRMERLEIGDSVTFTDVTGVEYHYEVSGKEEWDENQLREIISGDDWDLTLFTCKYSGQSRLVVRCVLVED